MESNVTESESTRPSPDFYDQDDGDNVCFLCGNPKYEVQYRVARFGFPFTFQRCQCGLIKQTPMPNKGFFEWFFNSDLFFSAKKSNKKHIWGFYDYFADEPSRLATSKRRYRELHEYFETGSPLEIMKIGPSTGTLLYVANQNGHHAIGCDVSNTFVDYAKEHYNVQIDLGRFEQKDYPEGSFDVIILFNVIENVPNQQEFLAAVNRALKPGGHFILNFVDMKHNVIGAVQKGRYFLYRPPICYIFDREVLTRVLRQSGFEVKKMIRDYRYMHLEKIFTLLGWRLPLLFFKALRVHQINFPIYAYPSRIVVSQKAE